MLPTDGGARNCRRVIPLLLACALVSWHVAMRAAHTPQPSVVAVAASVQSELGCPGDWQPECAATALLYDAADDVWRRTFAAVPAGSWEYKAALNGSWTENYGQRAAPGGPNLPLALATGGPVTFYYDHKSHWITENISSVIATVPGSFQSELGCANDWDPSCLRSWLQDPDGDGIYVFTTRDLPPGSYEAKVAIDESWGTNYGAGGVQNGPNIAFQVTVAAELVTFSYDAASHMLLITGATAAPQPPSVTVVGSFQRALGCAADWQPACAVTDLAFDAEDEAWQGSFDLPAGTWEYKVVLSNSWDENYGLHARRDGPNIPLPLAAPRRVTFYYDHASHWVTDNASGVIAVAVGDFQRHLGCRGDWDPSCLRSWLQDRDGDGIYTLATRRLPPGDYAAKVAIDEAWDRNYGAGGEQDGANIAFTVPTAGTEIFFAWNSMTHVLTVSRDGGPRGDLTRARAHWVSGDLVLWDLRAAAGTQVRLHHSADAALALDGTGIAGGSAILLRHDEGGVPPHVRDMFPHLSGHAAFRLPPDRAASAREILKEQVAVSATAADGTPMDATALQVAGALDELFPYTGPLGAEFTGGSITLRLWAPTARRVTVRLHDSSRPGAPAAAELPMTFDATTGVWSAAVDSGWYGRFYTYAVRVFTRATNRIETNIVTDPYSVSLSTNSLGSQLVDLDDPAFMPAGWQTLAKPPLGAPEDITLYELHIRDFSASDSTLPEALRGTYLAFAEAASAGMRHLQSLARAGLTHVHLLPSFDIASINEDRTTWQEPAGDLGAFPPDSDEQQARVAAVADVDGFNWGYDPWHYSVPDGSYATDPDGAARIREFRTMVQGLNAAGLRVVSDVVFNHTSASGQNDKSVLDRIVPGYYHRLDADGRVETSTCCENTATEHAMMEKLMVDSVLLWAKAYKVDGFRFDLMGHHMKRNMVALRAALDRLTPAADGVDGRTIYIYGEGWNFGEVANNARGVNAAQLNLAGTGIGSFNDRIRDAGRGGGPFSGLQEQGFLTGLFTDPNATDQGPVEAMRDRLLAYQDWIRVSLAGNLRTFVITDRHGNLVRGDAVDYNGQPAGYTLDPQETINYVEAHDNDTLWDAIQLKAPAAAAAADRVRMQMLGMSLVGWGQGIPFFHAGVELLRSKSLDRNSYNSGDWFNRLDFSYRSNNWGVGLPPERENGAHWPIYRPLLADPALAVDHAAIVAASDHFREVLAIRRSSPLFRLGTRDDITRRLRFLNDGPGQVPGVIAMELQDPEGAIDRTWSRLVVIFNAAPAARTVAAPSLVGRRLALHPLQQASADARVRTATFAAASGTFSVPGRTAAVFVAERPPDARIALLRDRIRALRRAGVLAAGPGQALESKLSAALAALGRGDLRAAVGQLTAFVHHAQEVSRSEELDPAEAAELVRDATAIIARLERGGFRGGGHPAP